MDALLDDDDCGAGAEEAVSDDKVREALQSVRDCLERENERGAISDTLWISPYETLFDYIDAALAAPIPEDRGTEPVAREIALAIADLSDACGDGPARAALATVCAELSRLRAAPIPDDPPTPPTPPRSPTV